MKKKYEKIDINADSLINVLVQNEIQRIKDKRPTLLDLKQRNLRRIFDLKEKTRVFCPIIREYMNNLMTCHIACPFGHITECHYPYQCQPEFCNHCKFNKDL